MMVPVAKLSVGLLLYRTVGDGDPEVLLVHPGGPLWSRRRGSGTWSIPKGELEPGEDQDPLAGAEREFAEELGSPAPPGERLALGEIVQSSGKRVAAWAVRGDFDAGSARSNHFEMEWPPKSGRLGWFPEIDEAAWFAPRLARDLVIPAQVALIDRLLALLTHSHQP